MKIVFGKTTKRICSFSTVFFLIIGIFSIITEQSFAQEGSITDAKEVKVTLSPSKLKAGETTQLIVEIDNSEKENPIHVKNLTVSPWPAKDQTPFEVKKKSFKVVTLDVTIPANTTPNDYTLIVFIEDSQNNTRTSSVIVTVKEFKPLEFSWMLGLLAAYLIPAQIIERIMEKMKLVWNNKRSIFSDRELDKIQKTSNELKKKIEFFNEVKKHVISNNKSKISTAEQATEFYKSTITKIDKEINKCTIELSKKETHKAFRIWLHGLWMAALPGAIFAWYGLGILQIMGYTDLLPKVIDAVINTAFIASGTKPIHDIISIIKGGKATTK